MFFGPSTMAKTKQNQANMRLNEEKDTFTRIFERMHLLRDKSPELISGV